MGGRPPSIVYGRFPRYTLQFSAVRPEKLVPLALTEAAASGVRGDRLESRDLSFDEGEYAAVRFVVFARPSVVITPEGTTDPIDFMGLTVTLVDLDSLEELQDGGGRDSWDNYIHRGRDITLKPGQSAKQPMEAGSYELLLHRGR